LGLIHQCCPREQVVESDEDLGKAT